MLFIVKGSGIEVEFNAENVELVIREDVRPGHSHGICDQLRDVGCDTNSGLTKREKHVHTREDGGEKHTNRPSSDGVGGEVHVVITNSSSHLHKIKS